MSCSQSNKGNSGFFYLWPDMHLSCSCHRRRPVRCPSTQATYRVHVGAAAAAVRALDGAHHGGAADGASSRELLHLLLRVLRVLLLPRVQAVDVGCYAYGEERRARFIVIQEGKEKEGGRRQRHNRFLDANEFYVHILGLFCASRRLPRVLRSKYIRSP